MNTIRWTFLNVVILTSLMATAQRLPDVAAPENYRITLAPDFNNDKFTGEETIHIRVLKPTSTIVLNTLDIEFQSATISSGGIDQTAKVSLDKTNQMATLAVEKPLLTGPADIHISYTGNLNNQLRGFYLSKANGRKYAVTQFESTDARRAFPSFDEPAYKATFDISAVIDNRDTAISNGNIVSDRPGPGEGKHTLKFASSPKMSSYLVALAVGDFEYIEGSAEGIPIRVWTTPGKKEMGRFALQVGEECVKYFDNYFGIKYPFQKLDLIGLPDFAAGAMENTAAITFRDALLLVDDQHAPTWAYKQIGSVISHEIAHQWFGDLVTMQWWDDVWLNEGFATWMETKPLQAWKPEWHMELADVQDTGDTLNLDSLQNTRPIHQAAETPAQIEELFDGIAYGKAAAVLRMLESYLGPDNFRAGVMVYLKAHEYGNATDTDFWSALAGASKKPVDKIMPTFVTEPGAPLVTLHAQCQGRTTRVTVAQQRYFYDRSLLESGNHELWMIPVCMKETGTAGDKCELLSSQQQMVDLAGCSNSVFGNAGAQGYYRAGYDSPAFADLSRNAEKDFTPAERIVLLRDVWAAVRAGQQPVGDVLQLSRGLQSDRNSAVIRQMDRQLDYIGIYLVSDADRDQYRAWVRELLSPILKEVGWQPKPGEDPDRKDLRAYVLYTLGYTARDPEVVAKARELVNSALDNPGSVDPSLIDPAFSLAALDGNAALYDDIVARLGKNDAPEQYYRYLYTLAHFGDPALLQRTLEYAVSPAVRNQDTLLLIAAVMNNPAGEKLAWQFVQSRWPEIEKIVGGFNTGGLVATTGSFCDAGMRDEVKQFFSQHPIPAAERSLRQALETVNYCIELKKREAPMLASWLQNRGATAHANGPQSSEHPSRDSNSGRRQRIR
jgi:aminopeptidase N